MKCIHFSPSSAESCGLGGPCPGICPAAEPETVVVTRHHGLVEYLLERGLAPTDAPVIAHASPEEVEGRRIIGVLPLSLAAMAYEVVEVPLALPPELRGVELSLAQVRQYAGQPRTYRVATIVE